MKPRHIDVVILIIAILAPVISFVLSSCFNDSQWFERSGSLAVLFAVIVEYRQILRSESEKRSRPLGAMTRSSITPGTRNRFDEVISAIGLVVIVLGTVIWGYGSPIYELIR